MGEQTGDALESTLAFIAPSETKRALSLAASDADRARVLAAIARINALYMIARAGSGHIGSSFSSLDIVAWLHTNELGADDVYFSSKGHDAPGLYAVLIALDRLPAESVHRLRRLGGLPGHPDVHATPVPFNTGSLGMGVSKAKGLIAANRAAGRSGQVFVLTGDGELQEGQFWESLAGAVHQHCHELTVIVDHNKLQSDTFVSKVNDLGDLEAKFRAFGWSVARCDGHDGPAVGRAIRDRGDGPHAVIADTVKGRGVPFMEHTAFAPEELELYPYHSGAPSEADYAKALGTLVERLDSLLADLGGEAVVLESVAAERSQPVGAGAEVHQLVKAYTAALVAAAGDDERIVALDADLVLDTGLVEFRRRFPDRFVECGIAEQDMVSQAGGMAAGGLLPFVHSFGCFLSPRANEQIFNNATEGRKVVYVGALSGLLPATPGHSHQSLREIGLVGGVPGMVVIAPGTMGQVARAVEYAIAGPDPCVYLRLTSIPVALGFDDLDGDLAVGRGDVLRTGAGRVVVTAYGPVLLGEAWVAAAALAGEGLDVTVVNLPFLNRLDRAWFAELVVGAELVVSLDDHQLAGGQGMLVATALAENGAGIRLRRVGIDGVPACGWPAEVLDHHGLGAANLAQQIRSWAGER